MEEQLHVLVLPVCWHISNRCYFLRQDSLRPHLHEADSWQVLALAGLSAFLELETRKCAMRCANVSLVSPWKQISRKRLNGAPMQQSIRLSQRDTGTQVKVMSLHF